MIRISCTNCKTILSIDDAFAGGVCRCQHCGTIQTVPAQGRQAAQVASAGQALGGSKSTYQGGEALGTGLDDLAGIVVSSGLSSGRLTKANQPRKPSLMPIVIGATVLVAVLLVVVIILLSRTPANPPANSGQSISQTGNGGTPSVGANSPSFCGTVLKGNTIIYLLDSGSATQSFLGDLKDATIKSVQSLGTDRKFQIMFWNNGTDGAYPDNTTTYASKENIAAAQKAIDDVAPFGQSEVKTALELAVAQHPDEIIIATAKGYDLDNKWVDDALAIRGPSPVKIHTFSLGNSSDSAPLKKLATETGGSYHELSAPELRGFGQ